MSKKLPNRARAVITGAGSGFGRAVALELAKRGARILVTDRNEGPAEETVRLLRARGTEAHAMTVDVRSSDAIEAMAAKADALFGGTDVLINNAGVAVAGDFEKIPLDDWRMQLEINLYGVIYGCAAFVPRMQDGGFILNVASAAGIVCPPRMAPYNVSKAGVIALSETLHAELSGKNIQVTALCPSFFRTNLHETSRMHGGGTDETSKKLITEAKWSAEEIAIEAIDGMLAGKLYVIPQLDGKAMWRVKRMMGNGFYGALGFLGRRGLLGP